MGFRDFRMIVAAGLLLLGLSIRAEEPLVAVHNFNVSAGLEKSGVGGWWAAERMESTLAQGSSFRVITRARIAKVLKERNIGSGAEMKPEALAKIAGAEFLITGRIDVASGRMTVSANMIAVAKKTGEITRSYEVSAPVEAGGEVDQAGKLLTELARLLTMTPGQFLDEALAALRQRDYGRCAKAVRELSRQVDLITADRMADAGGSVTPAAGETAGHLFDQAVKTMTTDRREAERNFAGARVLSGLKRWQELSRAAAKGGREKEKKLEELFAAARKKYQEAITARGGKDGLQDPTALCDEALLLLRTFSSNPPVALETGDRNAIEALIGEIENYRKKLFAGPSIGRGWTVPEPAIAMAPVAPGTFIRRPTGAVEDAVDHPAKVRISRPFWIGRCEVSVGQYLVFLRSLEALDRNQRYDVEKEVQFDNEDCPLEKSLQLRPGFTLDHPMTGVSWRGAKLFCQWLSRQERAAGRLPRGYEYRLPTEGEWELAARAGSDKLYAFGDSPDDLKKFANFRGSNNGRTVKCGLLEANQWGLHDIHGNVWEWCYDWHSDKFAVADCVDPVGPRASEDNCKVLRGGSFSSNREDLRCDARYQYEFNRGRGNIGFRVACAPAL